MATKTRIKFGPTPVCFQEVSQMAMEEVSIFRRIESAGFHFNSGSKVCVCAQDKLFLYYFFMPVYVSLLSMVRFNIRELSILHFCCKCAKLV